MIEVCSAKGKVDIDFRSSFCWFLDVCRCGMRMLNSSGAQKQSEIIRNYVDLGRLLLNRTSNLISGSWACSWLVYVYNQRIVEMWVLFGWNQNLLVSMNPRLTSPTNMFYLPVTKDEQEFVSVDKGFWRRRQCPDRRSSKAFRFPLVCWANDNIELQRRWACRYPNEYNSLCE